jgi:hypothetical protein
LFGGLRSLLDDPKFIARHRTGERDFTRRRSLPFSRLVAFLTDLVKGSAQDELDQFFGAIEGSPTAVRGAGKAALTQARRKLRSSAFVELSKTAVETFYAAGGKAVRRLKSYRVVAIDGTRLRLPAWTEIAAHFGRVDCHRGQPRAMAQVSLLVDVLNGLILDAAISRRENGEQTLAVDQIEQLGPGDLLVADRNYDAFWLLALARSKGAQFCVRMRCADTRATRREILEFVRSGRRQQRMSLDPGAYTREVCGKEGLGSEPLEVRLVRVELPSGDIEVLATSLLDMQEFSAEEISGIYSQRWGIEEKIKALKGRAVIERFTGKSVQSVEQDFHAKILATNLVQLLIGAAQREIDRSGRKRKHVWKINFTQALSKSKGVVATLLLRVRRQVIARLLEIFERTLEPVRPGRWFPRRVSRVKVQTHCFLYAPCR